MALAPGLTGAGGSSSLEFCIVIFALMRGLGGSAAGADT
jgi:hypothetical protein